MTTTLYRFYDASDRLLYVGIARSAITRWNNHRHLQDWWEEAAYVRLEHCTSRGAALAAERDAIRDERPLHNVVNAAMPPIKLEPEKNRYNCNEIAAYLQQAIRQGIFPAGSMLPTSSDLQVLFRVKSRTPIRDAFHLLRARGWLDSNRPGQRVRVRKDHPE